MTKEAETINDSGDDLRAQLTTAYEGNEEVEVKEVDEVIDDVKEVPEDVKDTEDATEEAQDEEITTEKSATEQEPINPPDHWGGSSKVRWGKLPRTVQEAISKDYSELAEKTGKYDAFERALTPHSQSLRMRYGDEATGVKTLLAYADALDKDPMGTLQYIAKERGIDLSQFGAQQQQGEVDPQVSAIVQQNHLLKQQLDNMQNQFQSSNTQTLQAQIDAFSSNPQYPYFNDVRIEMGALMQAHGQRGQDLSLEQAYDMAVNANPKIRGDIMAQQREKEEAQRLKKINAARAATTIKGVPGSGGSVNQAQSTTVRGALEEAYAAYI